MKHCYWNEVKIFLIELLFETTEELYYQLVEVFNWKRDSEISVRNNLFEFNSVCITFCRAIFKSSSLSRSISPLYLFSSCNSLQRKIPPQSNFLAAHYSINQPPLFEQSAALNALIAWWRREKRKQSSAILIY